jgi:hypothetical protein
VVLERPAGVAGDGGVRGSRSEAVAPGRQPAAGRVEAGRKGRPA